MPCTCDGTDPTDETLVSISPVLVTKTDTLIKASTTKEGLTVSEVEIMVPPIIIKGTTTMLQHKGSFTNQVLVVMTCTEPVCTIHYVVAEGSTPTSNLIQAPFRSGKFWKSSK